MKRETLVFILGFLVVLVPQLGVPAQWKSWFFILAGLLLMVIGYSLRRAAYLRSIENETGERLTDSFVESQPTTRSEQSDI